MEVKYKGEELNPLEFLTMIYSNLKVMEQNGQPGAVPQFVTLDMDVRSQGLATRDSKGDRESDDAFFPDYMKATSVLELTSLPWNTSTVHFEKHSLHRRLQKLFL